MSDVIRTEAAPAPVGAYPHAPRVGDLLFLSGVGPRQPGSNAIPGNLHAADAHRDRTEMRGGTAGPRTAVKYLSSLA